MEVPLIQPENSPPQTPLPPKPEQEEEPTETQLSNSLHHLETFLRVFGFCQDSFLSFTLSWVSFLLLGICLPLLIVEFSYCSDCRKFQIKSFELQILASQSLAAAISLLCVSHNLRKYGVRRFLFVDKFHGHMTQFREDYIQKIQGFFRLLAVWVLPCFLLKAAREVFRIGYIDKYSWWQSAGIIIVIHFENYGKLVEMDLDVSAYIEEHIRLTHHLSKISHRFRIFLLLEFLVVTASQFVALLQTTGNHGIINFINGGDFAVCSIVELVGIIICLHAAAKISHRAQALASVTSRWHALVTCNSSNPSQVGISNSGENIEVSFITGSLPISYSETDLEAADFVPVPTNTQLASFMSMYHKRQAFVTYMQSNRSGATIFGWTVDRALISTIFFVELSLVLFVLGKTITFTFTTK
ncbi:hypothetical protein TIFTF001_033438 [Ficus carica]|uniref:Uncharacterized protein n=1 Tax=Ficus carica TaxID=3494 RepID=A0AA88E0M8_FICCA|nr:hypothetical protein TIFTF001_033438 [Ficus carica]